MIGASIGAAPIGGSPSSSAPPLGPNIFLTATFGFESSYRIATRVSTFLNFSLITNDDNIVQVSLINILTGLPIPIDDSSIVVSVYAPGTTMSPIIVKSGIDIVIGEGYFQFPLTADDVSGLATGNYPWVAIVTLPDGSRHTVNCGDVDLTTGLINAVNRPSTSSAPGRC